MTLQLNVKHHAKNTTTLKQSRQQKNAHQLWAEIENRPLYRTNEILNLYLFPSFFRNFR